MQEDYGPLWGAQLEWPSKEMSKSEPGLVSLRVGEAVLWVSGKNQDHIGDLKEAREAAFMKQGMGGPGEGKKGGKK